MSPDMEKATKVFFPYTWERLEELHGSGARLVHYCSADTAISIIQNRRVWMRNASMMNDYSEIKYGLDTFYKCWTDEGLRSRLKRLLDNLDERIFHDLEERVAGIPDFVDNSVYLVCLSEQYEVNEHNRDSVKTCGRLSMWRAYGGATNVALVLNVEVFFNDSGAISAYSSPVCYGNEEKFRAEFLRLCKNLEANMDYLSQLGHEEIVGYLINAFVFSIVSFKHPGFSEEREWRVIYLEGRANNRGILKAIKSINGTPQKVYQIPLEDVPEQGLVGMTIQNLVYEILIGPVDYRESVESAIVVTLQQEGIPDAVSRVRRSSIPFRR